MYSRERNQTANLTMIRIHSVPNPVGLRSTTALACNPILSPPTLLVRFLQFGHLAIHTTQMKKARNTSPLHDRLQQLSARHESLTLSHHTCRYTPNIQVSTLFQAQIAYVLSLSGQHFDIDEVSFDVRTFQCFFLKPSDLVFCSFTFAVPPITECRDERFDDVH